MRAPTSLALLACLVLPLAAHAEDAPTYPRTVERGDQTCVQYLSSTGEPKERCHAKAEHAAGGAAPAEAAATEAVPAFSRWSFGYGARLTSSLEGVVGSIFVGGPINLSGLRVSPSGYVETVLGPRTSAFVGGSLLLPVDEDALASYAANVGLRLHLGPLDPHAPVELSLLLDVDVQGWGSRYQPTPDGPVYTYRQRFVVANAGLAAERRLLEGLYLRFSTSLLSVGALHDASDQPGSETEDKWVVALAVDLTLSLRLEF